MNFFDAFQVKICGLTRQEDAKIAIELGATAIGLIFSPGARQVNLIQARSVLRDLPSSIERVGVFVNSEIVSILHHVEELQLSAVQLHGQESSDFSKDLKRQAPQLKRIKAIEVFGPDAMKKADDFDCDCILFDSPRIDGVDRRPLPLSFLDGHRPSKPFLIAGGLNSENVQSYVENLRPDGVDVSSGVESSTGKKCPDKLRKFLTAIRGGNDDPRTIR